MSILSDLFNSDENIFEHLEIHDTKLDCDDIVDITPEEVAMLKVLEYPFTGEHPSIMGSKYHLSMLYKNASGWNNICYTKHLKMTARFSSLDEYAKYNILVNDLKFSRFDAYRTMNIKFDVEVLP